MCEIGTLDGATSQAAWLFLPRKQGLRALEQLANSMRSRRIRSSHRRQTLSRPDQHVDAAIIYGHWLFQTKSRRHTMASLNAMMSNEDNAEEILCFKCDCCDGFDECLPLCRECGYRPTADEEKDNAINIRLLFLETEEEKAAEKAQVADDWLDDLSNVYLM